MEHVKQFSCYFPRSAKVIVKVNTWWLRDEAADSFESMRNAYQALFPGKKFVITDAGRTHNQQVDVYMRKPGLAAKPGFSYHEGGLCVDCDIKRIKLESGWTQEQFESFALKYGFHRTVIREPWHFQMITDALPKNNKALKAAIAYIGNSI